MAMIVKNNLPGNKTLNTLNKNNKALGKSLEKIVSGVRINDAGDDASGYSISERMRVQIRALDQNDRNVQNATSMLKTAEGAIASSVDILKTMKEKAINAGNDTNTDADRAIIQKEIDQMIDQLDDNGNVTFNNKLLFNGDADMAATVEQSIIQGLNSEWISSSLEVIKNSYGISFNKGDSSVQEISVILETGGSNPNALAYVTSYFQGDRTSKLELTVNMDFYQNMIQTDVNGATTTGATFLDRTLAHEFTHAVMSANIKNFRNLPMYIKEGCAEYTHGIDDERIFSLSNLTAGDFATTFATGGAANSETPYSVGYVFLHYLNAKSGHDGDAMKRFMGELTSQGGDALDDAVKAATKGYFSTAQEAQDALMADLNNSASTKEFYKNYCDIDLDNPETGSITGSKSWNGDFKNDVDVIPEGLSTKFWTYPSAQESLIDGLTVKWPEFERPNGGFSFQIGTRSNQVIKATLGDIHARGLGVKADDGRTVSVATRANANKAIRIFDMALNKALDQQTTIGALQSRLSYTGDNIVTARTNVQGAESTLRDTDMAKEMMEYSKNNILTQATQSMLAQANQNSSQVLSLLQ